MSFRVYDFNFLETISAQLVETLDTLPASTLDGRMLAELSRFQRQERSKQGVYLLIHNETPVYLGKANDISNRLTAHLRKLQGRLYIDHGKLSFKAILLDRSMSTAANEELLIAAFSKTHQGMWNGKGFGSKDPGKNRDRTEPSAFDRDHPIIRDFPVGLDDSETVSSLFLKLKKQLPFLFRHEKLPKKIADIVLDLRGIDRQAEAVLMHAISTFPSEWHGAILSYGIVVYAGLDAYWHTTEVFASPGSGPLPSPISNPNRKQPKDSPSFGDDE
jgi:predicted GIY-YIG superfamily endonuclease